MTPAPQEPPFETNESGVAHLRIPPHSREAEQSVLGGLLLENRALSRIADILAPTDFYRHEHRLIYGAIVALIGAGEAADVITVFERLEGEPTDFGGHSYLNALAQSVPSAANIRRYAEIIVERATLRSIIAQADEMAARAFAGNARAAVVLDEARTSISLLGQQRSLTTRRVPLLTPGELVEAAQATRWLVKHIIPAEAMGMLFGASGTFKSFIALDAALHIAHGLPWLGRRTNPGSVLYLAAEGGPELGFRFQAWHTARRLEWSGIPFRSVPVAMDLRTEAWRVVETAQIAGFSPRLVVIDTLSQTYGGDEDKANEMSAYLREIGARFRQLWGCAVLIVHHTGHTATERPRGSSTIQANTDFLFGVHRDEAEMIATLSCKHLKGGARFDDTTFALSPHTLGTDEDGDRITSLVARHLTSAEEVGEAMESESSAGRGGKHQLLLRLLQNGMRETELRKVFYDECGIDNADTRRQAYHRSKAWAVKTGFLEVAEGIVITLKPGS